MIDYTFTEILGFDSFVSDVREAFNYHKHEILNIEANSNYSAKIVFLQEFAKLKHIIKKYSFLKGSAILLLSDPNSESPVHTDGMKRALAINVLLTEPNPNNLIKFYSYDMVEETASPDATYYKLLETAKPIAEYALMDNPIIVHTMVPHRITNPSDTPRISISFTMKYDEYSLGGLYRAVEQVQYIAKHS